MDYESVAKERRALTKASELLLGLVTGIVADNELNDMEIRLLGTWMVTNHEVTNHWPGSVLLLKLQEILADGVVTEAERAHLLDVLRQFAVADFSNTGSVTPEVSQLPIDDNQDVTLANATVCLTGEFLFGTRDACHRASAEAGAHVVNAVTRKTRYLIVGSNVSAHWANTSYGRKIQKAVELQQDGLPIGIISERRWVQVLQPS